MPEQGQPAGPQGRFPATAHGWGRASRAELDVGVPHFRCGVRHARSGSAVLPVLTAAGLSAGYRGRLVLHDVNLEFGAGLHLLLGPNGAGKTTLLRVLAGVLPPAAGHALVSGRDPSTDASAKTAVGVSSHRAALAPRLSVADNLYYWARILAVPPSSRRRCVEQALEILDLGSVAGQRAGSLSRGQAQRVSLARALVNDPPVLLLDEPLSGIDPSAGAQVRRHLRALADTGRTLLVSTHELAEASGIGDDVTVLQAGRVLGQGDASALRSALAGDGYRLRLRASGDLAGALPRLGYPAGMTAPDGAILVEVPGDQAVERLVADLVAAGIGIREVAPAASPLEDLYLRLQEREPPHDAS